MEDWYLRFLKLLIAPPLLFSKHEPATYTKPYENQPIVARPAADSISIIWSSVQKHLFLKNIEACIMDSWRHSTNDK